MTELAQKNPNAAISGTNSNATVTAPLPFVDSSASYFSNASTTVMGTFDESTGATGATIEEGKAFTPSFLRTARHPTACLFHFIFKVLAVLIFLFGSFMFGGWEGDYVFTFTTTTIVLSMDFWTVKNITGRLLVGMRWWNMIKDDGSSEWKYEAHTDEVMINKTDKTIFWSVLYLWPILWIVLLIIQFLKLHFEWLLLVAIALALAVANLVGYWRCSTEAKRKVETWASSSIFRSVLKRFF